MRYDFLIFSALTFDLEDNRPFIIDGIGNIFIISHKSLPKHIQPPGRFLFFRLLFTLAISLIFTPFYNVPVIHTRRGNLQCLQVKKR